MRLQDELEKKKSNTGRHGEIDHCELFDSKIKTKPGHSKKKKTSLTCNFYDKFITLCLKYLKLYKFLLIYS